jgi:hypothetical protein
VRQGSVLAREGDCFITARNRPSCFELGTELHAVQLLPIPQLLCFSLFLVGVVLLLGMIVANALPSSVQWPLFPLYQLFHFRYLCIVCTGISFRQSFGRSNMSLRAIYSLSFFFAWQSKSYSSKSFPVLFPFAPVFSVDLPEDTVPRLANAQRKRKSETVITIFVVKHCSSWKVYQMWRHEYVFERCLEQNSVSDAQRDDSARCYYEVLCNKYY